MTKVVNLDSLKKPTALIIEIDGKRHEMKNLTVEDFIENMKLVEELGINGGLMKEMEGGITIIQRAFPSITRAQIVSWDMDVVAQVMNIARGGDVESGATEIEGNVQKAN